MAWKKRSTRKLGSLILHFTKQLTIESGVWVENLRIILAGGGGGEFERSNLKKLKCPGEGVGLLKLRIDRRRNGDFTES